MPRKPKTQAKAVPTGGSYGAAQKLDQAQSAVPLPAANVVPAPSDWEAAQAHAAQFQPSNVPLNAPTQRPDEPITAGLPTGPGPGMDFAAARNDPTADFVTKLEAMYMRWPTAQLRSLLVEARGY